MWLLSTLLHYTILYTFHTVHPTQIISTSHRRPFFTSKLIHLLLMKCRGTRVNDHNWKDVLHSAVHKISLKHLLQFIMTACSLFIMAFQHTIHCIHNSYFNNTGCQNSTKTVTMEKSIIMQNTALCNQSIWLNGKTADLHYANISLTMRNLHITISILTHICSYYKTHMKDPFLA